MLLYLSLKNDKDTSKNTVQLASLQSHHFIPIRFSGMKTPSFFMVDTGATYLTLNPEFIESQNITDYTTVSKIKLELAGGQVVDGKLISFRHIRIGPWQLENIQAAVCNGCALLAGKSVLRLFQTTSKEVGGIEYMTIRR